MTTAAPPADGQPVDPASVPLGTRLVAVIEVDPIGAADGRLIVTDPLPAGFEIDNPNLLTQGDLDRLDWLEVTEWADMTEFRQDRFAAALTTQDDTIAEILGRDSVADFATIARSEWAAYSGQVTDWERRRYLSTS